MKSTDANLIAGFLQREHERFAEYLDEYDVEPDEATVIIESLFNESYCESPVVPIDQFSGFFGE